MIEGVSFHKQDIFKNEKGAVLKMLRSDSDHFKGFGEIYFSQTAPEVIKAWKRHYETIQNLLVIQGQIHLVMYDVRDNSPTYGNFQDVFLDLKSFQLVQIPPGVIYGWQAGREGSLMANCINLPYSAEESENLSLDSIPYSWS